MSGVPAMISMPDSTARASHAGPAVLDDPDRGRRRRAAWRSRCRSASAGPCRGSGPGSRRDFDWSSAGCGWLTISRSRLQVLQAPDGHVERRSPRRSRTARGPRAQHSTKRDAVAPAPGRRSTRCAALARRRAGAARRRLRAAARRPSDADPVLLHRLLGHPAGERQDEARDQQQQRRTRRPSGRTAGALSASASSTIVAASGRSGSKMNVEAVERVGREALRARDHREHDRLAERARGGEHGAGDDRRPRGAHATPSTSRASG